MELLSSCVLITFNPDAHEAGADPVSLRRTVKCIEKGVGMSEAYQAMGIGLNPEKKLLIPYERDYQGERELEYNGERWKVIRMGSGEWNGVTLTIQRIDGNSGTDDGTAPEPEPVPTPEPEPTEGTEAGTEAGGETG